ncbi:hypothetical protein ACGRHY_28880 [Streptomyces sp. HK10]|uniref:hypothetical protein n=1 Tax=Streptomyces sp. HK10 TaxID=3373255 RepID=UPI0037488AB9
MNPAARGAALIDRYRSEHGALDEPEISAADVVADLQVWAAAHGLDWYEILDRAERCAREELHCSACDRLDPAALDDDLLCPDCAP